MNVNKDGLGKNDKQNRYLDYNACTNSIQLLAVRKFRSSGGQIALTPAGKCISLVLSLPRRYNFMTVCPSFCLLARLRKYYYCSWNLMKKEDGSLFNLDHTKF